MKLVFSKTNVAKSTIISTKTEMREKCCLLLWFFKAQKISLGLYLSQK